MVGLQVSRYIYKGLTVSVWSGRLESEFVRARKATRERISAKFAVFVQLGGIRHRADLFDDPVNWFWG
jgi:hypothetical protein